MIIGIPEGTQWLELAVDDTPGDPWRWTLSPNGRVQLTAQNGTQYSSVSMSLEQALQRQNAGLFIRCRP